MPGPFQDADLYGPAHHPDPPQHLGDELNGYKAKVNLLTIQQRFAVDPSYDGGGEYSIDTLEAAEGLLTVMAGLDMTSSHGKDTPGRFINMLSEVTGCRDCTGDCMKWKVFDDDVDQMVVINKIPFTSVCNHHVVPFVGYAWIGYVPNGKLAGLSKFARVVHHFARRLQVQENLTRQVAAFLENQLDPKGVIVVTEAEHLCMTIRGVQTPGTTTRVVETRGVFSDHSRTAKHEFLMGIK